MVNVPHSAYVQMRLIADKFGKSPEAAAKHFIHPDYPNKPSLLVVLHLAFSRGLRCKLQELRHKGVGNSLQGRLA
jgi:hypothetical protein